MTARASPTPWPSAGPAGDSENRPGANGNLGAQAVHQAQADGYTLLIGSMFTVINPLTDKNHRYRTRNFVPVASIGSTPNVWVVPPVALAHAAGFHQPGAAAQAP